MRIISKSWQLIAFSTILLFTASCSNDDNTKPTPTGSGGKYFIETMVVNTETFAGRSYIQLLNDVKGQSVNNNQAIPIPLGYPKFKGNDIYVFPAYTGETINEVQKFTRKSGGLVKTSFLSVPEKSSATNIVFASDTKAYLSMGGMGKIWIFNPQTMKKTNEIDLTSLGVGDGNPDPSAMVLRDNLLYVGLWQAVGGYTAKPDRPYSDVAIINTKTDVLVKTITEKESGMSMPTRPISENTIFIDEKNDIYIICIGGFGMLPNHKSGFLRIKSGETEFDKNYKWDVTKTTIEGEPNKIDFLETVIYAGNGKAYAYAHLPGYVKKGENMYTAFADQAVEIDLYNKTIKKIENMPMANSFSVGVYKYKNLIVFPNFSKSASGFYTYNPVTKEVKGPIVKTTGFPVVFHYFE